MHFDDYIETLIYIIQLAGKIYKNLKKATIIINRTLDGVLSKHKVKILLIGLEDFAKDLILNG